jgi:serine protease Do
MRRFVAVGPSLVVLLTLAALLLGAPAIIRRFGEARQSARVVLARQALAEDDILERINEASRNVIRTAEPSVVHIEVGRGDRSAGFRRSSGSGWIYDSQGHLVTNAHVIGAAKTATIQFFDGRTELADVVAAPDVLTDIAVLKLRGASGIVPALRATGVEPRKGDRVFVFGSPFGFKFSVSQGIVSGLGRDANTPGMFNQFTNFIQTDAAVNPGNSGGPLVDVQGRVIGMNVAIATGRESAERDPGEGGGDAGGESGQSAGISFAIPLGTIESVVDQMVSKGSVARGYLGVRWANFGESRYYPSIERRGMKIEEVVENGPSARAGLRANDIVVQIGGVDAASASVAGSVISSHRPESVIEVRVFRDGAPMSFQVTLGEFPRADLAERAFEPAMARFGIIQLGRGGDETIVGAVRPDSPAWSQGLRGGQRIVRVGRVEIAGYKDLVVALEDQGFLAGRTIDMTIRPEGSDDAGEDKTISIRLGR